MHSIHCEQKNLHGDEDMVVTSGKKTYRDYKQLPEGTPYKLIDGELIMTPSPVFYHQKIVLTVRGAVGKNILTFPFF
jgi:hypothetical protein